MAANYARANCARGAYAADTFVHSPSSNKAGNEVLAADDAGPLSENMAPQFLLKAEQWEARRIYNENA
ncbi:hypothetical protein, partial [uncultured Sphingorhabdus sp.]|uniref:hypothetical protein n=1 Tax=uncultured Sphingorhabdus sp. TaxID=1686106 RepID=UPI00260AB1F1